MRRFDNSSAIIGAIVAIAVSWFFGYTTLPTMTAGNGNPPT